MRKAYGYMRCSSDGQKDGDSFPRQKTAIEPFCKSHQITVVRFFEEAITGTEYERPIWNEMILELEKDGVKIVVVEALHRFARDLLVQENMLRDLRQRGFELISTCEPDLCSDDPTRKLIRQVMGSISEYEKSSVVLKLKVARARKRKAQGWCEGRKKFADPKYPGELAVLKRMRELRSQGQTFHAVAVALNSEGLLTRTGKSWFRSGIQRTLKRS